MKLADMTVGDYLDLMASDAPAPGGGSASALCGAQGAGLVTMVAGLTVGKKKYAADSGRCASVLERGMPYVAALKAQIDRDTEAFEQVSAAFHLPKETAAEKTARSAAIQQGTLASTEAPLETMRLALRTLKNARDLLPGFNASAASDLGVAALELLACVRGAWLNVLINIASLKDREKADAFRREGEAMVEEAEQTANAIYAEAEKIILA